MRLARNLLLAAAAAGALAAVPASAHVIQYRANIQPLNTSGVTGTANFFHDTHAGTLNVRVRASGLVPGTLHPQHIHGLFQNQGCTNTAPSSSPIAGACLDGTMARESNIPTLPEDDIDGDGFLETVEGAPAYGPILLNLSDPGAGRAGLPGSFPMSDASGNLFFEATYDLSATSLLFDSLNGIEHEVEDLFDLTKRVYVIHGKNAVGPGFPGGGMFEVTENTAFGEFVVLLPAGAGEIERVPEPAALGLVGLGLLGLAGLRRRKAKA